MALPQPPDITSGAHTAAHGSLNRNHNTFTWAGDYATLQAAIDAAGSYGHVVIPYGTYTCNGLDITNKPGIIIEGATRNTTIKLTNYPLDLCGSDYSWLHNLTITGDATNPPLFGIIQARTSGHNGSDMIMDKVTMTGKYTTACIVNYSSERNVYEDVIISPTPSATIQAAFFCDSANDLSITSQYQTIDVVSSDVLALFNRCSIICDGAANFYPYWFGRGAHGMVVFFSYLASTGPAYVKVDGTAVSGTYKIILDQITGELAPTDGVLVTGNVTTMRLSGLSMPNITGPLIHHSSGTITGLTVDSCRAGQTSSTLEFDHLLYSQVGKWWESLTVGGITADTVIGSEVMVPTSGKTIGTDTNNVWHAV